MLNLTLLDRFDEARQYAELMPEDTNSSRDDLIVETLKGEEKRAYRQKMIFNAFRKFLGQLYSLWRFEEKNTKKAARRRGAVGGNTHFAPAAPAADVNSFKGRNACSDDI